jgi:UDP-glucose 4-epimerase
MKIAITGGAGFIGTHLTKAYLDAGHDVLVIDNLLHGSRRAIDPRARFSHLDIRDGKLRTLFQRERPDLVSHHAALYRQQQDIPGEQPLADADVHVRGLLNVLESSIDASVSKVIFASGGNTLYGRVKPEYLPLTEDTPLDPQHPYDISTVAGERYVRYYAQHYGLTYTILRYADVYGETNGILTRHPLSYFICMLRERRRPIIRGTLDEVRDHIFIDDVVRANLRALTRGENQTLHISSGRGYPFSHLYQLVADILESEIEPVYLFNPRMGASSIVLDNTRARHFLGWQPEVNLSVGIWRAVELLHEQSEPPVPLPMREVSLQAARSNA